MKRLTLLVLALLTVLAVMPMAVQAVDPIPPQPCPAAGPGAIINGVPACYTCVIANGLGVSGFGPNDRTLVQIMNNPAFGVLTLPDVVTLTKVFYDASSPAPSPDGEVFGVCAWIRKP